jgi:DNA-binding transcriptional MerR regulator
MQDQQHLKPSLQGRNLSKKTSLALPEIPDKIYFTIGEVSKLCLLEPYVLRYWEQEFSQLSPTKRCGNRRYYKRDEIILIRRIKDLLYEQGFTIEGARLKLGNDKNISDFVDVKSTALIKNIVTQLENILVELERNH